MLADAESDNLAIKWGIKASKRKGAKRDVCLERQMEHDANAVRKRDGAAVKTEKVNALKKRYKDDMSATFEAKDFSTTKDSGGDRFDRIGDLRKKGPCANDYDMCFKNAKRWDDEAVEFDKKAEKWEKKAAKREGSKRESIVYAKRGSMKPEL
ncbi:unnamed protein product [Arabis nemorensis]|uniref:Uncharacterized protein n=1 Tax=Arabis nemorensis TaxID=586526 RepID=A0A565CQS4_9BRAS|nr:unnamed protein product [Arabis nemorensis]